MNGIWIRSQDRETLVQCSFAYYEHSEYKDNTEAHKIEGDNTILGRYPTRERALEVLDEIQHAIINATVVLPLLPDFQERRKLSDSIVFEMPLK